ncbi:DUF6134 family protein [Spirosoma sp. SC4-14]|uniref:DUF6134 family protein n=1 Tax=Spirosoma sp. SC4-14 TaxID=3128900 RepID=UPI0030CCB571
MFVLLFGAMGLEATAQKTTDPDIAETHHYAIDIAGIRVGTMTAVRQSKAGDRTTYILVSDVKVNLLIYTVKIYYKVVSHFEGKKLMLSTVEAQTNRGNYGSRTEWQGDHYTIVANQYKYNRQAIEPQPIDFSVSSLYFYEPAGRNKVYAEYFGDYFTFVPLAAGAYRATLDDRQDDYFYQNGRLVKVIKHNSIKNFVVRLLD